MSYSRIEKVVNRLAGFIWMLVFSLWLVLWFFNPYVTENIKEIVTLPGLFMLIVSLVGIWTSFTGRFNIATLGIGMFIFYCRSRWKQGSK